MRFQLFSPYPIRLPLSNLTSNLCSGPYRHACHYDGITSYSLKKKKKKKIKWTASSEFGTYRLCEQRRFRRACASAQSRQNLRCSLIQAVSQEEPSDRKPDPWPLWMAGHAQLKSVMTECSKTQIRLTGLKWQNTSDQHINALHLHHFHAIPCTDITNVIDVLIFVLFVVAFNHPYWLINKCFSVTSKRPL